MHNETAELHRQIAVAQTPFEKAELLNKLSVALRSYDKHAAWDAIRRAVDEARQTDSAEMLAMSLWRFGVCCRALGQMDEAIAHCEEALEIARAQNLTKIHQGTITSLGVIYQQQGNYDKALKLYEESFHLSVAVKDQGAQAIVLSNIGLLHTVKSNFRGAFEKYHQSVQLYSESNLPVPVNVLFNIAQLYFLTGNYKESLEYLFQALPLAREQKNVQVEASILTAIIEAHHEFGEIPQALAHVPEATTLLEQAADNSALADTLALFSKLYADAGNCEASLHYIRRIEELAEITGIAILSCVIYFSKGYLYYTQKNYSEAIKLFTESILSSAYGNLDQKTKIATFLYRSLAYEALTHIELSLKDMNAALEVALNVNSVSDITAIYFHLARLYEQSGNTSLALDFYKKYSERKIQQLSEAAWYQTQNLLLRFETEKAQQQAELLRLRNESLLKDSELQQQELKMLGRFFVQTSEIMQNIQQQVNVLKTQISEETTQQLANRLLKYVKTTLAETENHRMFEHTFEKTHGAFLQQLSAEFPMLTQAEMRVSALLKTGLNTKEIASTLNISTRTVEEHRGNIRRKMNIPADIKLGAFFAEYGKIF